MRLSKSTKDRHIRCDFSTSMADSFRFSAIRSLRWTKGLILPTTSLLPRQSSPRKNLHHHLFKRLKPFQSHSTTRQSATQSYVQLAKADRCFAEGVSLPIL